MEVGAYKPRFSRRLIGNICFMAFGVSAFSNSIYSFNIINAIYGIILGLLFGWLFKKFLTIFLGILNRKFKRENGKETIKYITETGILFIVPFSVMILISVFYLNWSLTSGFISAGIMAAGTASSIEIGKIKGKQEIRNTIATSLVSFLFSLIWTLSYTYTARASSLLEGGLEIIKNLVSKGGAGL